MFKLFRRKKKDKKDIQVLIGSEIAKNKVIQQSSKQMDAFFAKPEYNPHTRKTFYDNGTVHKSLKENAFSNNNTVKDPYSGLELVSTIQEAKKKYGNNWQEHLAEVDHIDPLNKLVNRAQKYSWVTSEDINTIGNSPENLQLISRRLNQTGGKGGNSQTEWSQDLDKMNQISKHAGDSVDSIAEKIRITGENAEKRNDYLLKQAGIKNATMCAHEIGKAAGFESSRTAAKISGIYNIVSCIKGEKTVSEALKDVGADSSKAFASGYTSGTIKSLDYMLKSSESEFLSILGKKNIANSVISTVSITGDVVIKWGTGEISTKECLYELGNRGCNWGGSVAVGAISNFLVPGIGSTIGSLIGGTLTSSLYEIIMQGMQSSIEEERRKQLEIYEAMIKYYAEQQRRKEVQQLIKINTEQSVARSVQSIIQSGMFQNLIYESASYFVDRAECEKRIAECVLITLQLKDYREQLQECMNKYFKGYEYCFASALDTIDTSLENGNYDSAIAAANQITNLFGKKALFDDAEDFKNRIFTDHISF